MVPSIRDGAIGNATESGGTSGIAVEHTAPQGCHRQRGHQRERGEWSLAPTTKVTPEMLNNAAKVATSAGETIALNLTRLLNEIEGQAASFQGSAGTSFQNVSAELGQELRGILEALNTMADSVNQSSQVFGSTDQDASQEIGKVTSQYLPGAGNVASALRG
jgi:WXG100 family type VII secretion target